MSHRPKKRLGQHFLVNRAIASRIVEALDPKAAGAILEIGPGKGVLTDFLARLGRPVFAVEKDRQLVRFLEDRYRNHPNVRIVEGDILDFDMRALCRERERPRLSVIGNVPFQITSPLFDRLLQHRKIIEEGVLMIQKEVADRLVAPPGNRVYGGLTVIVGCFVHAEVLFTVRRGSFLPPPEVDAAVLKVCPDGRTSSKPRSEDLFVELVHVLFGWRRKQIRTTLRKHKDFALSDEELTGLGRALGYSLSRRPEDLAVEEFVDLADRLCALREQRGYPQRADG